MYSNIKKISRITTVSDLLERRQRNKFVNFHSITDPTILQQLLVKQTGTNPSFFERSSKLGSNRGIIVTASSSNGGLIGSFKILGYTLGAVTPAEINAFKQQFALKYGISANLITITLAPGSLVVTMFAEPIPDISELSDFDKCFFINSESMIRSMQSFEIDECITKANLTTKITKSGGTLTIDTDYSTVNTNLDMIQKCGNYVASKKITDRFNNAFVGDDINDCIYTIINLNQVVRINKNGTTDYIATFPNYSGCRAIFLNLESTYLIIPTAEGNSSWSRWFTDDPSRNYFRKVFLINIKTGAISTIQLIQLSIAVLYGFDKLTRRFYYSSGMNSSRVFKLCYITIPPDYSSDILTATYFANISTISASKLEFVNSNIGYIANSQNISLIDLSVTNGSSTVIAGSNSSINTNATWSNAPNAGWTSSELGGPFLDSPIGANAFFSAITDICYDSINNRLLVVDSGANRIRSVDLRPGNNYAVTTIAGTSPTFSGLGINSNTSNLSQAVLGSLLQVGSWGNKINAMPAYNKVNGTFLNSTFTDLWKIVTFNKKIYYFTREYVKQLSNNYVSDFSLITNYTKPIFSGTGFSNGGLVGSIKIIGYNVGNITEADMNTFKNKFAEKINITPNIITITLVPSSPSLIINMFLQPIADASDVTTRDMSFFFDLDTNLGDISVSEIDICINRSGLSNKITKTGVPLTIDSNYTTISRNLYIIDRARGYFNADSIQDQRLYIYQSQVIGDPLTNNMYVIGEKIRRTANLEPWFLIKFKGRERIGFTLCTYPSRISPKQMFINQEGSYLIIPDNPTQTILLINTETGVSSRMPLSDPDAGVSYGFDKLTRKLYYFSAIPGPTFLKLCYVTIPADYSQTTALSATFFNNISVPRGRTTLSYANTSRTTPGGKIEFIDSNTCFVSHIYGIAKIDLRTSGGSATLIAGLTNTGEPTSISPPLDSPIGTNAVFTTISDICYDSINNRLLVADQDSNTIRSVDLKLGNNYAVTTIAGNTPVSQSNNQEIKEITIKVNSTYAETSFSYLEKLSFFKGTIYANHGTPFCNLDQLSDGNSRPLIILFFE